MSLDGRMGDNRDAESWRRPLVSFMCVSCRYPSRLLQVAGVTCVSCRYPGRPFDMSRDRSRRGGERGEGLRGVSRGSVWCAILSIGHRRTNTLLDLPFQRPDSG